NHDSQHAAGAGQRHGFHQKLADDVAAARPQRFADADLARALGHAHQHDVHYADAPHQQAERGDGDGHQADQAGDAVELLDNLVGRGDGEIILLAGGHAAYAAHDALHFREFFLPLAALRLSYDHEAVHLRVAALGGAQRDDDGVILTVLAEESAFRFGIDADDGVLGAVHHHGAAVGRAAGEQRIRHVGADEGDVGGTLILL